MREKWIWDESQKKLVKAEEYRKPEKESSYTFIEDSMPETWHPINGKYYTSKNKFRAVTRAAGCVEYGNEDLFKHHEKKAAEYQREESRKNKEAVREAFKKLMGY